MGDPELERAYAAVNQFCSDMLSGVRPYCLTLLGPSGTGKTLLAREVWNFFQKEGVWYTHSTGANLVHDGRFCTWPKTVARMKEGDYGPVTDLCEMWFSSIDDVGAENDPSRNGAENLMRIFNSRRYKWTFITSNLSAKDFETYEARLISRLIRDGNRIIEINTMDYNLRNQISKAPEGYQPPYKD